VARGFARAPGETLTADENPRLLSGDRSPHNKIPRYIEFVDEFPMTVTGKIQKFLMRDAVGSEAGVEGGEGRREK